MTPPVLLFPDAGPLITLGYADALDLLLKPRWQVQLVDMVWHELTRSTTPTSKKVRQWASDHAVTTVPTRTFAHHQQQMLAAPEGSAPKAHLGELAIQEHMNTLALADPAVTSVFLFEDHKIARASFLLPANCKKVSTRAYLQFLEQHGLLDAHQSAASVERAAINNGRNFSSLHFPLA